MDKLIIKKYGINGEGIGYLNKKPVFVEGTLVDEEVMVEVSERKPTYMKAQLVKIVKPSKERITPPCDNIDECGGCTLMHTGIVNQGRIKVGLLQESLEKYAGIKAHSVVYHRNPKPLEYRNQLKMPVSYLDGKIVAGFYKPNTRYFIPVNHCIIHDPKLEAMRKAVLEVLNQQNVSVYEKGKREGLRFLVLRILNQQIQCTLVTSQYTISKEVIDALRQLDLVSVHQSINTSAKGAEIIVLPLKKLYGKDAITFNVNKIKASAHPYSFYQLNTIQAAHLYKEVEKLIRPCSMIVEAYSGLGIMSLMVSTKAETIVGCDINEPSIRNANSNAALNRIENVKFSVSDSAEFLKRVSKKQEIDYVIVDPPRIG